MSAVLIGLLGIAAVYGMWAQDRRDIAQFQLQIEDNQVPLRQATELRDRLKLANNWYTGRATYLDALDRLTTLFPETGDIWITNLSFQDDGTAAIVGDALDRPSVLRVLEAMEDSDRFTDITTHYLDEVGKDTQEISFAIRFKIIKP